MASFSVIFLFKLIFTYYRLAEDCETAEAALYSSISYNTPTIQNCGLSFQVIYYAIIVIRLYLKYLGDFVFDILRVKH